MVQNCLLALNFGALESTRHPNAYAWSTITTFFYKPSGPVGGVLNSMSENPDSSCSGTRIALLVGMDPVSGTARGPVEAGEWGGPCPDVGDVKPWF